MQKLLDFDVVIESHGDGFRTRVLASPAGQAQASFVPPFTEKDLEILILRVIGSIGRARRQVRRIESPERRQLEDFGGQLFKALFSGPVHECLSRSRMAAETRDAGLRIRLRLPGALANIPWEYLHDEEYGFLSMSPETALVRYVEMPTSARPFPVSPPLRILAMISAPSDVAGLEAEQEWRKLRESLGDLIDRGMVEVDRLETGTLAALQRPLRLRRYHVLHFVGHGVYDEEAEDGALALEGPDGKHRLVTGRDLGVMIRGHRSLRLVVLNACEGARSARDDPFGGVAQALVRQGIPAVIAMQFEISDPAAVVFSQSFYQAIADGLPVDMAMVEARIAMFAEGNEVEWATPVLYLRSPDGRIFTKSRVGPSASQAREEADQRAREEAGQRAQEEAGQRAREEAEQRAREEAGQRAWEEAEQRTREEAEQRARKEADRKARKEAEERARFAAMAGEVDETRPPIIDPTGIPGPQPEAVREPPAVASAEPAEPAEAADTAEPKLSAIAEKIRTVILAHSPINHLFIDPDIPEKQRSKVMSAVELERDEPVLGVFDLTVFGTGGYFLVLTDRRFLHRSDHSTVRSIRYQDISPAQIQAKNTNVWIDNKSHYWNGPNLHKSVALLKAVVAAASSSAVAGE